MCFRFYFDVSWQLGFLDLRRNGRYDYRWTEAVTDIILDDENGTHPALLRTDDRRQIRIENIPAFHNQILHPANEASEYTLRIFFGVERLRCHMQVDHSHFQISALHRVPNQSLLAIDKIMLHRLANNLAAVGILLGNDKIDFPQQMIRKADHNAFRIV